MPDGGFANSAPASASFSFGIACAAFWCDPMLSHSSMMARQAGFSLLRSSLQEMLPGQLRMTAMTDCRNAWSFSSRPDQW